MYIYFLCHHTTGESTCDTLSSSAANLGDNTVSLAQGGTATTGATKQLLPPERVSKKIYIYIYTRSTKSRHYIGHNAHFTSRCIYIHIYIYRCFFNSFFKYKIMIFSRLCLNCAFLEVVYSKYYLYPSKFYVLSYSK